MTKVSTNWDNTRLTYWRNREAEFAEVVANPATSAIGIVDALRDSRMIKSELRRLTGATDVMPTWLVRSSGPTEINADNDDCDGCKI